VGVEKGGDGMQTFFLLVAREVLKVIEEVCYGPAGGQQPVASPSLAYAGALKCFLHSLLVVVDSVSERVVLGVLLFPRLVDCRDDSAGLGYGQGVNVLKITELNLVAHLFLLLNARLRSRNEAGCLEDLNLRRLRAFGLLFAVHG
jgi:hypothetical protein